jgi:hypothetical protein
MNSSDEAKYDHPTQKPIDLMRRPILNRLRRGELVYDPFLGSGTTLAAAELTERVCYGIELDPKYVDVVVERWQSLAGKRATLDGDGRTFEEIAREVGEYRREIGLCPRHHFIHGCASWKPWPLGRTRSTTSSHACRNNGNRAADASGRPVDQGRDGSSRTVQPYCRWRARWVLEGPLYDEALHRRRFVGVSTMLKALRRMEKLEKSLGLSARTPPVVHRIKFIASEGRVTGFMVLSQDPAQFVGYTPYKEIRAE